MNLTQRCVLVIAALSLAVGCASKSDHDALVVRVATIEAEMAAQERQDERLSEVEDRLSPPDASSAIRGEEDPAACNAAKRVWRDLQPRVMSWLQDNEPEIFAAWLAEPPGTPDDERLWEVLASSLPNVLTTEIVRAEIDGELHCGFDEFSDYIDHGYNTGAYPD